MLRLILEINHLPPAPRHVRLSNAGIRRFYSPALIGLSIVIIASLACWLSYDHLDSLFLNGKVATGIVEGKEFRSGFTTRYWLNIRFNYDGKLHPARDYVSANEFIAADPRMTRVLVTFLPTNPKVYEIDLITSERIHRVLLSNVGDSLLGLSVPVMWTIGLLILSLCQLRFTKYCLATKGEIYRHDVTMGYRFTPVQTRSDAVTPIYFALWYSFTVGGKKYKSKVNVDPLLFGATELHEKVIVLYDPKNPWSNRLQRQMAMISCEDANPRP